MVQVIELQENYPFPNNPLPVLIYPKALEEVLGQDYTETDIKTFLEQHNYSNSWTEGIHPFHHFHSNTHEVVACFSGKATVQLGGPDAETLTLKKGDLALLPAGVAHKKIDATSEFQIVGAYPNGRQFDMQKGDKEQYDHLKETIAHVPLPSFDPIEGKEGAVQQY